MIIAIKRCYKQKIGVTAKPHNRAIKQYFYKFVTPVTPNKHIPYIFYIICADRLKNNFYIANYKKRCYRCYSY